MDCVFYLQSGIKVDFLPQDYQGFYICENLDVPSDLSRYFYKGDGLQYELDSLCVELYDVFRDKLFSSTDEYYKDINSQPQWITRAGLDSDFDMSKEQLIECFSTPMDTIMAKYKCSEEILQRFKEHDSKKYRYAYLADCQSLINTLQELLRGCNSSFIGFYTHLCSLHTVPKMEGHYYECSIASRMVFNFLYSFIIQIYSTFDILAKIAYEMENINDCESSYAKLVSSKILFGDKKHLKLDASGTVFEKCPTISIFENLRNELVHNATWEMNPKIFINNKDNCITERYIFMPDFTREGTLETYKNRKRFFSYGKKVNDVLPQLYFEVLERIQCTITKISK